MSTQPSNPLFQNQQAQNFSGGAYNQNSNQGSYNNQNDSQKSNNWSTYRDPNKPKPFTCWENNLIDDRYWWKQYDQQNQRVKVSMDESAVLYGIATSLTGLPQALRERRGIMIASRIGECYPEAMYMKWVMEKAFTLNMTMD